MVNESRFMDIAKDQNSVFLLAAGEKNRYFGGSTEKKKRVFSGSIEIISRVSRVRRRPGPAKWTFSSPRPYQVNVQLLAPPNTFQTSNFMSYWVVPASKDYM